ncbi:unnamed protein product, partial [Phaeothamnion confervicola]
EEPTGSRDDSLDGSYERFRQGNVIPMGPSSHDEGVEGIRVTVRVRPSLVDEEGGAPSILSIDGNKIALRHPKPRRSVECQYDAVLDENCDQGAVFDVVARPALESVLQGINSTIFAYGQTGSGKSHTML